MNKKRILVLCVFFIVVSAMPAALIYAQGKGEGMNIDTNAYEMPPQQGAMIPCELCVVLYPQRYEKEPKACPVCNGSKEHFQSAQMMDRQMAQMRLHEIDVDIQEFLYAAFINSEKEGLDVKQLKKLRKHYHHKLVHLMVYDFIEVEAVKEKIIQLDEMIEK